MMMTLMGLHPDFSASLLHSYTKRKNMKLMKKRTKAHRLDFTPLLQNPRQRFILLMRTANNKMRKMTMTMTSRHQGGSFFSMANALPKLPSKSADANLESIAELNEGESDCASDDEGPPPGWEKVLHHRMPPSCTSPLQPSQAVSSDIEMGSQQETSKKKDEMPQSESWLTPLPLVGQSLPPTPQLQQLPPSVSPAEAGSKEDKKDVDKGPTSVPAASPKQSVPSESGSKGDTKDVDKRPKSMPAASPKQSVPSASHPSTPNVGTSSSEKAQLVCGTCRKLLLYPRGAKWVQCPGCQEVNFVLEAHEVGQVKCGNCAVLLMYPHGAPAVQCTSCSFVTEMGAINRRPPLSVQMAQRRRRPIRGRAR